MNFHSTFKLILNTLTLYLDGAFQQCLDIEMLCICPLYNLQNFYMFSKVKCIFSSTHNLATTTPFLKDVYDFLPYLFLFRTLNFKNIIFALILSFAPSLYTNRNMT